MEFLDGIGEAAFEAIGTAFGLLACTTVLMQVIKELQSGGPSSLSPFFLIGWVFIYLFWGLYGIRFRAEALWITNGIALTLQLVLCFVVFRRKL